MQFKCVVSSHVNHNLSGVAKFNHILAGMLSIPCIGIDGISRLQNGPVLLSLKLKDSSDSELARMREGLLHLTREKITYDLFLHTFDGLEIEYELLEHCRRIFCGNAEIGHAMQGMDREVINAWCPGLVDSSRVIQESKLNLFSFGMAHKIQVKYYRSLWELLQQYGIDYALWVSTAFHEKANFGDFNLISNHLSEIFTERIKFLGFLSDEAINYFFGTTHLFVAFFEKGVRANNTSIYAAMVRGVALLTNCDEYSPLWMRHGENILDIHQMRPEYFDIDFLRKIGEKAQRDVHHYASWDGLVTLLS